MLNKNISGFRKHRPRGDMGNNYVLLSSFHWPCWLVCVVDDVDYFVIQIRCQRLWIDMIDDNMQYIIVTEIECSCVDWLTRTATKDPVTQPPKSQQVWVVSLRPLKYINNRQDRMQNEVSPSVRPSTRPSVSQLVCQPASQPVNHWFLYVIGVCGRAGAGVEAPTQQTRDVDLMLV